jgi:c-di-GMP-binding flagellar brake protein YcgR
MFERTFSFWRRWIGKERPSEDSGGGTAVAEDRRLWVRYDADLEAHVQPTQSAAEERSLVRVRDISLGGIHLVTDRPFQPGQILSVELPTCESGEHRTVLACVVRLTPEADGQWSLGCVFSRELSADDLERFGATKTKATGDDKRTHVRFESSVRATYQRVGDPAPESRDAQVLNISATGVGLMLTEGTSPGSLLHLTLHGKQGQPMRSILACVVYSTERASGEVAVGCNFIRELGEDELHALL